MNILIKIHPFSYLLILVSLLTGHIKELLVFLSIVVIHELGHVIGGLICKWDISNITLMPFGCITTFSHILNKPLKEEALVCLLGPIFQFIYFIIFKDIKPYFNYYNYGLFIFNMLPIYPMDGYKILSIILCLFIPYKKVLKISLLISFIVSFLFIRKEFIYLVIFILLVKGIIKEYRNISNIYNKFLLERYLYNIHFKKIKIIKNIDNMYREYRHLIKDKRLYTEKEALMKRFQ